MKLTKNQLKELIKKELQESSFMDKFNKETGKVKSRFDKEFKSSKPKDKPKAAPKEVEEYVAVAARAIPMIARALATDKAVDVVTGKGKGKDEEIEEFLGDLDSLNAEDEVEEGPFTNVKTIASLQSKAPKALNTLMKKKKSKKEGKASAIKKVGKKLWAKVGPHIKDIAKQAAVGAVDKGSAAAKDKIAAKLSGKQKDEIEELKFGSKAQYSKYKKDHNIKPGTKIDIDGKKSKEKAPLKTSKAREKESDKFADAENAKLDAAEKMAEKEKNKNISKKDKKTLGKVSKLMKTANEGKVKKSYMDRNILEFNADPYRNVKGSEAIKKAKANRINWERERDDNQFRIDNPEFYNLPDRADKAKRAKAIQYKKTKTKPSKNRKMGVTKMPESKGRKITVKEVKQWMRALEENRYKRTYVSDCRRVSWLVNNMNEDVTNMPKSMRKKWTKAQYGRERQLATEFIKHFETNQMNEGKLTEASDSGKIKLSSDAKMHWGSDKAVIKTKEGTAILTKKELLNLAKGFKKYRLDNIYSKAYSEGKLTSEQKLRESIKKIIKRVL